MKDYPSIPNSGNNASFFTFYAHVFDKYDGSNIRAEWDPKLGWHRFGTRTQLVRPDHPVFGVVPKLFAEQLSEPLTRLARDQKWQGLTVFCEFWGPNSFAGEHDPNDSKTLTLFDLAPYKKGILGPEEFLRLCGDFPFTAKYHGVYEWNRTFVAQVRAGTFPSTFEGVVGKAGDGHHQVRAKAKTQAWVDKVLAKYSQEQAAKIIAS